MANTTYNIDIQVQSKSLGQLEAELSQINAELKEVEVGSKAFKELSKQSQNVTKQLEKVNNQIKGVTMEDKFTAANGAVKLLGGSLAGVIGTLGVLGIESEAFGEFEKKAASAIAVAVGFRDVAEGLRDMRTALKGVTVAQLKANAAAMANPYVLLGVAIAGLTAGLAKLASTLTDDIVGPWESFTNMVKSFGDPARFAALQAESMANNITKLEKAADNLNLERAIAVMKEFGQETIDLEIKLAEDKLKELEKGSEEYEKAYTDILVLRARRAKKIGEDEIKAYQEGRAAKLKELQEKWKLEADQDSLNKEWAEESGQIAAEAFTRVFGKTVKEEFDINSIFFAEEDPDLDPLIAGIKPYTTLISEELDKVVEKRERWDSFSDTATTALNAIFDLSQQKYDRDLVNLQRERSTIETNTKLTEAERIASLNKIEEKEKQVEARRIKAERDEFTLKQTLALAEIGMKLNFDFQEFKSKAKLHAFNLSNKATEIAVEGAVQTGKATMSLGAFVSSLGPLGVAAYAVSIGGIIASIISARKKAKSALSGLGAPSGGAPSSGASTTPQLPNITQQAPIQPQIAPTTRTYVLAGDVTSAQEADAKLSRKRTLG